MVVSDSRTEALNILAGGTGDVISCSTQVTPMILEIEMKKEGIKKEGDEED